MDFSLVQEMLEEIDTGAPDEFLKKLTELRSNGLTKKDVLEFVDANMSAYLVDDIVSDKPDDWEAIGVDPKRYVSTWLDNFGDGYFSEYPLSALPSRVSLKELIDFYTVEELEDRIESFDNFIVEYKEAGGNTDDLAQKIVEEYGYRGVSLAVIEYYLDLVVSGATVIEIGKVLSLPRIRAMEPNLKEYYYENLLNSGRFNEKILAKLRV